MAMLMMRNRCPYCGLEQSPEDAWLAGEGSLEGLLDNDERAKTERCGYETTASFRTPARRWPRPAPGLAAWSGCARLGWQAR
jgi:hypothetical protein